LSSSAGLTVGVIVPAFNEASRIVALVSSLAESGFMESIIADGGSTDGTVDRAEAAAPVSIVYAEGCRGTQVNAAVRRARSDVLVLLHADTELPPGALALIQSAMKDEAIVGGCFRLRFDDISMPMKFYAWTTRFETGFTTFGDQAFFFRKSVFEAFGGVPEWPFMEDVELRRRLKRKGRFVKLPQSVTTSSRRFVMRGRLLGQLRNAAILIAFRLGVSPFRLASFYGVRKRSIAS
jgi:rSAM/selenodomain-associated transferase 2